MLLRAALALLSLQLAVEAPSTSAEERLRILIETDAGGDPDDEQSLVRFLLYANEWDVEGIIANRAEARNGENLNSERTGLGIAQRLVKAYGQCYAKLVQHDPRYPQPEELLRRTVAGYNESEDGVNLILAAVDRDDPRPLCYSDWGSDRGSGIVNMKRALDKVYRERTAAEYPGQQYYWANLQDSWGGTTHRDNTLLRWATHLQNDFKCRLDWCVRDFAEANHPPVPQVEGELRRTVRHGTKLILDARGSTDPDKDRLQFEWVHYPESGNFRGTAPVIESPTSPQASLIIRQVEAVQSMHVILIVSDVGTPPLTRYQRVILTVDPTLRGEED